MNMRNRVLVTLAIITASALAFGQTDLGPILTTTQDQIGQASPPANPPAGQCRAYFNTTSGVETWINSSGASCGPTGGGGGGNINPGTGVSQSTTWNPNTSLWTPTKKPDYDLSDPNWAFNCNGTAYNTAALSSILSAIGSAQATIDITQPNCGIGDILIPKNVELNFQPGGSLNLLTDNSTAPGGATRDTTAGSWGNCVPSANQCATTVTAPAQIGGVGDTYAVVCGRGFTGGALTLTSSVPTDMILTWPGTNPGFSSINQAWMVPSVVAGSHTFTATSGGNIVGACTAVPIVGAGPTPWLDGTGGICSNVSPNSPYSCTATFQAGSFLIFFGSQNNSTETCGSPTAGFTLMPGAAGCSTVTGSNLAVAYLNSSSAGSVTPTIPFSPSPAGHFWAAEVLGLRPSSARLQIQGTISVPQSSQVFLNATGSAGNVDFTGSTLLDSVRPEWWGAGSAASASTNTAALQAAIWAAFGFSPASARVAGSGNLYNRPLYLTTNYNINGELQLFNLDGFTIQCSNRLTAGITQTASNARIFNAQAISYGVFGNCNFSGNASSTLPLIDIDQATTAAPDLKPQFIDFYNDTFGGGGVVAQGVLIAKSGGGAQGSNINFFDPEFNSFSVAALQVGTSAFLAQNALAISVYNGDFQGNHNYGFADYGGGYIEFFGTTMENGGFNGVTQTGPDYYCNAPQGDLIINDSRSESRLFAWCDQAIIRNSRTIDQAAIPVSGSTQPVGTVMTGDWVTGDGAYYNVTVDSGPFSGIGTTSAPLTASSGSSTTLSDTNQTVAGSVTIGQVGITLTETMTQAVTGSTATRINRPSSVGAIAGTLTSGAFAFGDTATQAVTGVTCTVGSGNTSTNLNCSNFSGVPDSSHTYTDGVTLATFSPSAVPVFSAATMLITVASGAPDSSHDWVGGTTGMHFTPVSAPVNEANFTTNAFTGMTLGVVNGTDIACKALITSNTAQSITFTGGFNTNYPFVNCASNPDTTSQYLVGPTWNHGTVVDGGITMVYSSEQTIQGSSGGGMQGRIEDSYFAGGQIFITGNTIVKNTISTRSDWYNSSGGNTPYGQGSFDWDMKILPLGMPTGGNIVGKNWSLPNIGGGGMYSGPFHQSWGVRPLCWQIGNGTNSSAETCIGGRSDPNAVSDPFRNRVEVFSGTGAAGIGPPTPVGLNVAGIDYTVMGGDSTGSATGGKINFSFAVPGSSGTTPNTGVNLWHMDTLGNFFNDATHNTTGKISTPQFSLNGSQAQTGVQGSTGTKIFSCTGSFVSGNFVSSDANGNCVDSGVSSVSANWATGAGCTTAATANATCITTLTLNSTEPNTNYAVSCTGIGISGFPYIAGLTSKTTSIVNVETSNGQGSAAVASGYTEIDCVVTGQ